MSQIRVKFVLTSVLIAAALIFILLPFGAGKKAPFFNQTKGTSLCFQVKTTLK